MLKLVLVTVTAVTTGSPANLVKSTKKGEQVWRVNITLKGQVPKMVRSLVARVSTRTLSDNNRTSELPNCQGRERKTFAPGLICRNDLFPVLLTIVSASRSYESGI